MGRKFCRRGAVLVCEFFFDRRTKEHIWVWPVLLWSLCTCVWSLFLLWLLAVSFWPLVVWKIAIKREQSQACLGYAEREQFGRSQNGELNSRGFSNPWKASRFNYRTVCKDGDFNTDGLSSPRPRCRSASLQTPFLLLFCSHGLKSPRLFAFGFASCQTPCFVRHIWQLGGFDLCIVFNV